MSSFAGSHEASRDGPQTTTSDTTAAAIKSSSYTKPRDSAWLQRNKSAADALVAAVRSAGIEAEGLQPSGFLFRDVPVGHVMRFLGEYRSHEDSPDLDGELVRKYIERQLAGGALTKWSVAVMAGSEGRSVTLGGMNLPCITRAKLRETGGAKADIKTLMTKEHRVVDLPVAASAARAMGEQALVDLRNDDESHHDRGLLLLYPIDPEGKPDPANAHTRSPLAAVGDVVGLALVFPGNATDKVDNTYVTVDLSGVDVETDPLEVESLETDAEDVSA